MTTSPPSRAKPYCMAASLAMMLILTSPAVSQGTDSKATPQDDTPAKTAGTSGPDSVPEVRVLRVSRRAPGLVTHADSNAAGMDDLIDLQVQNLQTLVDRSKCRTSSGEPVPNCEKAAIALFVEGREIKALLPESGAPRPEEGRLSFHIARTAESDEAWADILGAPPIGSRFFARPVEISVGLAGSSAEPTDITGANRMTFVRIRQVRFFVCTVLLLAFMIAMVLAARKSDMLRDSGPAPPDPADPRRKLTKAYSLGRLQMAWWFFWVIVSFLFIWQITGATDIVTPSVLALIGIGAGTSLGAAAVDLGKTDEARTRLRTIEADRLALEAEILRLDGLLAGVPAPANLDQLRAERAAKAARLVAVTEEIARLTAVAQGPLPTDGFINDILTDGHGMSFHRFQMFVWTIVLWMLFVFSVYHRLSMPDFSATLLALLGISAGTYLGFKIPERQA
jgi:hypothetical protein